MHAITTIKKNVTPLQAQQLLQANGLTVNEKEAAAVVNFLYTLASLKLSTNEKSIFVHKS